MDVARNPGQSAGMSEEELKLEKGARVAIVGGRKGNGVRGEIFWIGENKYGPGMRYGVKGDDAETYWVDQDHIGPEDAVPETKVEAKPALDKGQWVEVTKGRDAGQKGEIFWVGDSRFGAGKRYGLKNADDETIWADGQQVEPIETPPDAQPSAEAPRGAPRASDAPPADDAPFPDDAPLPEPDDRADAFDDDIPFPGDDDVPF